MTIVGYLFGLSPNFFDSAVVPGEAASEAASSQAIQQLPAASSNQPRLASAAAWRESGATCLTCGIGIGCPGFESPQEQRQHFKTDWHRYNVKRRLAKQPAVSEEQFERILEQGTEVSISGSESDSSEEESDEDEAGGAAGDGGEGGAAGRQRRKRGQQQQQAAAIPRVTFQAADGSLFSVWRCLLRQDHVKAPADQPSTPPQLLGELRRLRAGAGCWMVVLLRGGHFAATVFKAREGRVAPQAPKTQADPEGMEGLEVVAHKTFHRYVVRAKAGGKQSSKDATGKFARSAGSRLRRYNEVALERDVQELLASWSAHIASADLIFVHAPASNARSLFSEGQTALLQSNPRLRRVPFVTHRPTFSETKRVMRLLCAVFRPEAAEQLLQLQAQRAEEETTEAAAAAAAAAEALAAASLDATSSQQPSPSPSPPPPPSTTAEATYANKDGSAGPSAAAAAAAAAAGSPEDLTAAPSTAAPAASGGPGESPLHKASKAGDSERVRRLLEAGHDPCVRDAKGRTAYGLAADKDTRDAFRRFMAQQPDRWDYSTSGIPSPLTDEMEAAQSAKKAAHKAKLKAKDAERKAAKAAAASSEGAGGSSGGAAAGAARKQQAVEDEIALAVAEAAAIAAKLNASSKASSSSSGAARGGGAGKVGGGGGGGKAGKSATGGSARAAASSAAAAAAAAAPPSAEELARRREVMAAAAEARMRALSQASQQQKLW
ncbi:hypothetical protein Agub_g8788 [Astrephomene gubernaculifera]|uniref:VLRF1 domain-containing protein n=1 Tax=Astrephomene gubernaculifera TaxID=47775 RepID=A0AAD3HNM5_9CHLO|nr:hypothetical protein Agub_g8788 [Astrephomene gubernaculifera]